ncbi:hypothetical protein [Lactovum miscens]|uniref:IS30 family transposase n=1 Tax=Lactovum miscens TaxID=190387 RepID=A0A841C611_9LACT|nr:hypothetical protein [Lactovum miscens]MBB5887885.1 IS30 family transposase [Lactovum miscens]
MFEVHPHKLSRPVCLRMLYHFKFLTLDNGREFACHHEAMAYSVYYHAHGEL